MTCKMYDMPNKMYNTMHENWYIQMQTNMQFSKLKLIKTLPETKTGD